MIPVHQKIKRTSLYHCARCSGDLLRRGLHEPPFCSKCRGFYMAQAEEAPREHADIEQAMLAQAKWERELEQIREVFERDTRARHDILAAGGPPKPLPQVGSCSGRLVELFIAVAVAAMGVTVMACILIGLAGG